MKTEDLIKYALIAVGAYLVWEYVLSPMITGTTGPATAPGTTTTTTPGTTTTVTSPSPGTTTTQTLTQPAPVQTSQPQTLQALLIAAAGNPQFGLNVDQWSYYYAQLPGRVAIPANTFSTIMTNLGVTDANRSTTMLDAQQFVGALNSVGLSGMGQAAKTNLRGGFSTRRPNAFSGAGGGSGRRQMIH
jgi:hypothetical protein